MKLKKDDHDNSSTYINAQEFNKLMSENFAVRLAQAKWATKGDIADLKKIYFDDKLKNSNKKVTSNKTKRIEVKTKLDDVIKVKIISPKWLTADLINKYSIRNGVLLFLSMYYGVIFFFRWITKLFRIYIN